MWEYHLEHFTGFFLFGARLRRRLSERCNAFGREGWELTHVQWSIRRPDEYVLFFKRPVDANGRSRIVEG